MIILKFCPRCGKQLIDLKTKTSWEVKKKCSTCGVVIEQTYGDGGSNDAFHFFEDKYNESI